MIPSYNVEQNTPFCCFILRQRKTRRRKEHGEKFCDYFVFDMLKKEDVSSDKKWSAGNKSMKHIFAIQFFEHETMHRKI